MLKKISDNNDNRGHSIINFVMVVIVIMVIGCGFLDMINLVRLKSIVNAQANIYASAAVQQSGFRKDIPSDWKSVYGDNCTNYITKSNAVNSFKTAISHTNGIDKTCRITLGGKNLASESGDVVIAWQEESEIVCSVDYHLDYLDAFGLINETFVCKTAHKVVGFWIHKTTQI